MLLFIVGHESDFIWILKILMVENRNSKNMGPIVHVDAKRTTHKELDILLEARFAA